MEITRITIEKNIPANNLLQRFFPPTKGLIRCTNCESVRVRFVVKRTDVFESYQGLMEPTEVSSKREKRYVCPECGINSEKRRKVCY